MGISVSTGSLNKMLVFWGFFCLAINIALLFTFLSWGSQKIISLQLPLEATFSSNSNTGSVNGIADVCAYNH